MIKKMKIKLLLFILLLFIQQSYAGNNGNMLVSKDSAEEGVKRKVIITANAGLNLMRTVLIYNYTHGSSPWNNHDERIGAVVTGSFSPVYCIGVDYGITEWGSVGLAFGYQTITIHIDNNRQQAQHYNAPKGFYDDTWKRMYFGARFDYYISKHKNYLFYTGVKLGWSSYTMNSTLTPIKSTYPTDLNIVSVSPFPINVQHHLGYAHYFNGSGNVGLNAELGLGFGGPYMLAVGLTVKI